MLKQNIWHRKTYTNYYDNKTDLYDVYQFDYEIWETANEITNIPGTMKKVVSYLQK